MTARIIHADCLDALADLPDESVHAVVCDPPYGLANTDPQHVADTLVRWVNGEREFIPEGAGFMGKAWDAFVPPPAVWDECFRVLKPGGHLLCFAGTRTVDLMGLSIRLAGFDIRDSITWVYGSGFPKSLDVGKAIDKLDATAERRARALEFTAWMRSTGITTRQVDEVTGTNMGGHYLTSESQPAVATADLFDKLRPMLPEVPARIEELVAQRTVESANYAARGVVTELTGHHSDSLSGATVRVLDHGTPQTPEAQQWRGWGTALKPSSEPIVVARKPLAKGHTVAASVLAHGTGALNIDACRVGTTGGRTVHTKYNGGDGWDKNTWTGEVTDNGGRWPANVVLDEHAAAALDADSGTLTSGANPTRRGSDKFRDAYGDFKGQQECVAHRGADSGGASRFFPVFKYQAKAPTKERPSYEKDGEAANPRITGHGLKTRTCDTCGVRFPHGGAVQTCGHDGWSYVDTVAEAAGPTSKVAHPTVKPVKLMSWLVRLVTPPGGTVLDPFAGSGTTVEAAILEGFDVIGIEREADYLPLIQQRIDRATAPTPEPPHTQDDLFGGAA